jgi:hypothetical protein
MVRRIGREFDGLICGERAATIRRSKYAIDELRNGGNTVAIRNRVDVPSHRQSAIELAAISDGDRRWPR